MKTIGDWIKVQRQQKNLSPGHLAAKMGIAQPLVLAWEDGTKQLNSLQIAALEHIFGSAFSI